MKERIYINDWLRLKPYEKPTVTDSYYLKLSNRIKETFKSVNGFVFRSYLVENNIKLLSCFLASWFEDIISKTKIWLTFTQVHRQLYGKILPFYDTSEYYDEEPNWQDLSFLLWYFLNIIQEEKFISPFNDFIINTANELMNIFDEEFEYAPENKMLKDYYSLDYNESDYYTVRNLIDTILFKTWLFYPDSNFKFVHQFTTFLENGGDQFDPSFLNEIRDQMVHTHHTRLLALTGKEWASRLIGEEHPVGKHLLNMSKRIRGYFFYKSQTSTNIVIEHIASGKQFKLTKKSFDYGHELTRPDTILYLGIVKWMDEWWFSGLYFKKDFDANLVLNEKNSLKSRMEVGFLDNKQEKNDALAKQQKVFLKMNNGAPVVFLPTAGVEDFFQEFITRYNQSLNLSEKEQKKSAERMKKSGFFGKEEKASFENLEETAMVYFNPESGIEVAMGINSAFPLPENPYFDETKSGEDILYMLMSEEISISLTKFGIETGREKLAFYKEEPGKLYMKDLDFLLRFWKKSAYFPKPEITFIG